MSFLKSLNRMNRSKRCRQLVTAGAFLFLSPLFLGLTLPQAPSASREYQIKAVFLFNFAQFVEWPKNSFAEDTTPLIIGILGNDPFGDYLASTVSGEKINSHPLIVQRFAREKDVRACHILFINLPEKEHPEQAMAGLKGKSILTVGESRNFIHQGGIIRFFTDNNKIRIQINLEEAKGENLQISSKLLRLADIVVPRNN